MKRQVLRVFCAGLMAISLTHDASADQGSVELPYELSDVDQPPSVIIKVDPIYPMLAKPERIAGEVTLRFIVTKTGEVKAPSVLKSSPQGVFDKSALEAIRKWRFKPATKAGEAVDVVVIEQLKFSAGINGPSQAGKSAHGPPFELPDVDQPPRVIKRVDPAYPAEARKKGLEGVVTLKFIVTKEGKVIAPSILKSSPEGVFDEGTLTAIRKWRFKPAVKGGEPVDVIVIAPLHYSLPHIIGTGRDTYEAVEQGVSHMNSGDFKQAIRAFTRAIRYFPREPANSPTYVFRGLSYMKLGKHKKAVSDFGKALKLRPGQAMVHANRGEAYARLGKFTEAIEDCSAAIGLDPQIAGAYANRGISYWELGKPREALEDCSKAIELDPKSINAYYIRGSAHRKMGEYEEAVADYTQVISKMPDYVQAYNYRAYAYNRLGKMEQACADMARACELGDCRGSKLLAEQDACE